MTTIMISRHYIDFNSLKSSVHTNTRTHKYVYSVNVRDYRFTGMISQANIKIQCKKLSLQKSSKKCKTKKKEPTNRLCRHIGGYYCFHICLQPDIFIFSAPNVSLEDDKHLLHISKYRYTQVQSHRPWLWSHFIGRESRK